MGQASRTQKRASKVLAQRRGLRSAFVRVPVAAIEDLHRAQRLLMAIVKEQGRCRVSTKTMESLTEGDRITAKHDGDGMIVSYVAGEQPAEGAPG